VLSPEMKKPESAMVALAWRIQMGLGGRLLALGLRMVLVLAMSLLRGSWNKLLSATWCALVLSSMGLRRRWWCAGSWSLLEGSLLEGWTMKFLRMTPRKRVVQMGLLPAQKGFRKTTSVPTRSFCRRRWPILMGRLSVRRRLRKEMMSPPVLQMGLQSWRSMWMRLQMGMVAIL
jgi:hypothetical protein